MGISYSFDFCKQYCEKGATSQCHVKDTKLGLITLSGRGTVGETGIISAELPISLT